MDRSECCLSGFFAAGFILFWLRIDLEVYQIETLIFFVINAENDEIVQRCKQKAYTHALAHAYTHMDTFTQNETWRKKKKKKRWTSFPSNLQEKIFMLYARDWKLHLLVDGSLIFIKLIKIYSMMFILRPSMPLFFVWIRKKCICACSPTCCMWCVLRVHVHAWMVKFNMF